MDESYDLVVIGAGPGGYIAAVHAAELGFKTACIEKTRAGGTCLNIGCIPSKALLQSSEHVFFLKEKAAQHGISIGNLQVDFDTMQNHKEKAVNGLVKSVEGLFKAHNVSFYHGTATLLSPNEIEVTDGKKQSLLKTEKVILATGSEPIALPFAPFDEQRILSSTGALALKQIPKKLIVIGAGAIGLELASVYNRLGSNVAVLEMLPYICPTIDREIARSLQKSLQKQGLKFLLNSKVMKVAAEDDRVHVFFQQDNQSQDMTADHLLVCIGRRPFSQGLGLEKIGVVMEKKFVRVDQRFLTSVPNIYAIGDLIEGPGLAHRASEEALVLVDSLAGKRRQINYMAIPNIVYTYPEAAGVGLTEEEAKQYGCEVVIGKSALIGNPRARASGDTEGLVKIIAVKDSGTLLGLHIACAHASEMIGEGMLALEKRATLETIAYASHAHPTYCEAIKEAALEALKDASKK